MRNKVSFDAVIAKGGPPQSMNVGLLTALVELCCCRAREKESIKSWLFVHIQRGVKGIFKGESTDPPNNSLARLELLE
jgi:hypothetical protein